jgi:UDP-glucose 4-epimerase
MEQVENYTNLKDKKVLIIGGLGFIGSNLACKCLDLGAKVTIFDCLDPNSGGNLYNIQEYKGSIELLFSDIRDFGVISQAVIDKDIIFNCAASTSHAFSMREPWIDLDVNSRSVINILEAIRRFNKEARFVHLGTSTQLGKLLYKPADENHAEFPTDIYSANKSASEKYVLIYAKSYKISATVIRLSNIFGPRASIHSPNFTFNNYFIGLALQDKTISIFGDGEQMRNVLFVEDAVIALIQTALKKGLAGETLFAVSNNHYSVAEIAKKTVEYIKRGAVEFIPWPPGREIIDVGDAIISNKKIKSEVGWNPKFSIEQGMLKTKKYFEKSLHHYLGA